jgi:hypothetical protein
MKTHTIKQIESPLVRQDPSQRQLELHKENEQLKVDIVILKKNLGYLEQRNHEMLKNEIQYRNLIKLYQQELKKLSNNHELLNDLSEKHQLSISEIHNEINSNISNLQGKIDEIITNREELIIAVFNSKLKEINDNLEKEKKEKFEDLEKGAAKKNLLKHELEVLKGSIGVIEAKNTHLETQNKELKHLLKVQDLEINALQKKIFELKEKNVVFPNIKTTRETSKSQKEIKVNTMACETDIVNEDHAGRYQKIIQKLQKLLTIEKNNVRAARNAYFRELNSRSEIEETIIACIEEVKKQRKNTKKSAYQLSYNMSLVEKLTNSEIVLNKLKDFLNHKCEVQEDP